MNITIHPEWQNAEYERWILHNKATKENYFVIFRGVDLRPDLTNTDNNLLWLDLAPHDRRMIYENGKFRVANYYQILENETV